MSDKRLIETAFPLAEASAASLHEKNMRHGHISTLHLWPARRPLAASRAAIAAALLPDPRDDEARNQLVRRLGGRLKLKKQTKTEAGSKIEASKVEADGGILWWGQEFSTDVAWFREKICAANGGRRPRVLDPFAGGGAIPLEAMRLGCDVVANDLNPVAWLILKCTLDYPQRLASQKLPLPMHAMRDAGFAASFLKALDFKGTRLEQAVAAMTAAGRGEPVHHGLLNDNPWEEAALGWHVRAWGGWVLTEARRQLAARYPTFAEWQTLDTETAAEPKPLKLLPSDADNSTAIDELNRDLTGPQLRDSRTSRWVPKPTVAYLWARTLCCPACRAVFPLLKTKWLCQKRNKRVLLKMESNAKRDGVNISVYSDVPVPLAPPNQRNEIDRISGQGTLSRSGATCPCCNHITALENLKYESVAGRLGALMTAVIVEGHRGKEYRRPQPEEEMAAESSAADLSEVFRDIPFGMPTELIPLGGSRTGGGTRFSTPPYGLTRWDHLFLPRQLVSLGTFVNVIRRAPSVLREHGYPPVWIEILTAYLALAIDRLADYGSVICSWNNKRETLRGTFARYAIPIVWDFTETSPLSSSTGNYLGGIDWISKVVLRNSESLQGASSPGVLRSSATQIQGEFDAIITDPPYYDAIPYSDLMDFFYVWLRRSLVGLSPEIDAAFSAATGPKWNHAEGDGELIDEASRFGGSKEASKRNFEEGMATVFRNCSSCLRPDGIFVIVFANKNPDAWETLVNAVIRAGFVVEGSLPIQTERSSRPNALSAAALSSSVWLVCRKRPAAARPGFAGPVLTQMREKIRTQMHRFWDAGIRGPDFLWAATGPALEAFSRHPVVYRETSNTGQREQMPVAEFLREVRRLVVEFAVGRVLRPADGSEEEVQRIGMDDITTYYVLHRDSFGIAEAPIGACILYALSCGLSDADLADRFEILARAGSKATVDPEDADVDQADESEEEETEDAESGGTGNKVRLRRWDQRKRKTLGLEGVGGLPVPMIDRVHRLMQLWKAGDLSKVNGYLDQTGLARDTVFAQLVQALIELARRDGKGDEAPILESISNHLSSRAGISMPAQASLI
jgi:putative DNA methylase